ncbi:MAG TPA: PIN domain-containing protein [Polyangia bacterium]|nr:PIN domain-containing protein [Polyangia bacterium]
MSGPSPTQLVDTNIFGELSRPRPNSGVLAWAADVRQIAVSVITVEEVSFGLSRRPIDRIRAWFDRFLADHCEVLDVTRAIATLAGTLRGQLASHGQVRTQTDLLIGATAAHHGLTLVTRNVRDFEGCGVVVWDPFT